MEQIQSRQNPRVKRLVKLAGSASARCKEGLLLAEGIHLLQEAVRSGVEVDELILSSQGQEREEVKAILPSVRTRETLLLSNDCYQKFSALKSPEGVAFLARPLQVQPESLMTAEARLVVLAGIQDPGNAGAILRTAEASGMNGAIFLDSSVDPTHPALLRASMGACFRLPAVGMTAESLVGEETIRLLVAHGEGGIDYRLADYAEPFALVIGAEGAGVPETIRNAAHTLLSIPMAGQTESLNAAVAAGLLMYESARDKV
ncbi:MAG: TrmH family RNA methyltransferase [Planctomycetota bacterium]